VKFLFAEPIIAAAFEVWALAFQAKAPLKTIAAAIAVLTTSFRISSLQVATYPPLHVLAVPQRTRQQFRASGTVGLGASGRFRFGNFQKALMALRSASTYAVVLIGNAGHQTDFPAKRESRKEISWLYSIQNADRYRRAPL
jgi:hypothetical protein